MTNCKTCYHKRACASWIRHGETLYDDFEYSVDNCPHYNEEIGYVEQNIHLYWKTFISGAAEFMKYIQKHSDNDVEDLLVKFCEQYGEVRKVQNETILSN